ncbi:hypothetical protein EDC04DRAFT_2615658 [Pisolithus marmoratus]|nr:hypothetical protein EDC04DRAFT_2615658 [Pisolithus marmoratus]
MGLLLQQEELVANGDLSENKDSAASWERALSKVSPKSHEQYQHTYDALLWYAPGLKNLLNNHKKKDTLHEVITEMNKAITGAHSDDVTCLKAHIRAYAMPHPLKVGLDPPLSTTGTRLALGLNHLFLTRLLCPSSARKKCFSDPVCSRTCQELQEGKIAMTTNDLPLFLWSRDTPGCNIDNENKYEDLFQGYYLERVMCHIFTGPSTALGMCSAHAIQSITNHTIEARHAITSQTKWTETDGSFNYCTFYYNVVDIIRDAPDKDWVEHLKKWWNMSLFKSKIGHEAGAGAMELCSGPPDASSSSLSWGLLLPGDPSAQSSCPHSPSALWPPQQLSAPHRETHSCSEPSGSGLPLVLPVASELMLVKDNGITPKELPVVPLTLPKAKKTNSKGNGWCSPHRAAAANGASMRVYIHLIIPDNTFWDLSMSEVSNG